MAKNTATVPEKDYMKRHSSFETKKRMQGLRIKEIFT